MENNLRNNSGNCNLDEIESRAIETTISSKLSSVAIIGAGAAGLCALRHFAARPDRFHPIVCFEQTEKIGGIWNYDDDRNIDSNAFPRCSVYRDMRVNGPVQIMGYPDFEFDSPISYTHHTAVLQYLHQYVRHFDLRKHIRFDHRITNVTRDANQWKITAMKNGEQKNENDYYFDVIIFCPGRYQYPVWPSDLPNYSRFTGSLIHSCDYRFREPYAGKRVAVVGAGPSGIDIVLELSSIATQIIFIQNQSIELYPDLPANIRQILSAKIERFTAANSIVIRAAASGQSSALSTILEIEIDAIIFATGFRISLDYLDQQAVGVKLDGAHNVIDGVYRHFINIAYPTMALLSICKPTLSFPIYHQQILYFIRHLLGEFRLPSAAEMRADVAKDLQNRSFAGLRPADRHLLKTVPMLREYLHTLERDARLRPLDPVIYSLLDEIIRTRKRDPIGYKDIDYRLVDDRNFVILPRRTERNEMNQLSARTPLALSSSATIFPATQNGG